MTECGSLKTFYGWRVVGAAFVLAVFGWGLGFYGPPVYLHAVRETRGNAKECSPMKLPQTGGCQCGEIRYEITQAPQMIYACHCTDCQRITSSAFSQALVLADEAGHSLKASLGQSGALLTVDVTTPCACPKRGSWVCRVEPRLGAPQWRAGTLDDTCWVRPTVHL
jgi:hypothetical protein